MFISTIHIYIYNCIYRFKIKKTRLRLTHIESVCTIYVVNNFIHYSNNCRQSEKVEIIKSRHKLQCSKIPIAVFVISLLRIILTCQCFYGFVQNSKPL